MFEELGITSCKIGKETYYKGDVLKSISVKNCYIKILGFYRNKNEEVIIKYEYVSPSTKLPRKKVKYIGTERSIIRFWEGLIPRINRSWVVVSRSLESWENIWIDPLK